VGKWEMVRLGDVCKPKQWKTIAATDLTDRGYPVYGANGRIGFYNGYTHGKPTVLVTCRGATCGTINICEPYSYVNGNAMALDDLIDSVDLRFLSNYLTMRGFTDVITGSAQPQIIRSNIEKIEIPLPPLEVQRQIAGVLDRASTLIEKRKAQIEKLDLLVKSQFIEMFGTVKRNPYNFDIKPLGDVCKKITDGKHGGCELETNSGYYYVGAREIYDRDIHYDTAQEITFTDFSESYRRCNLENGDLVIVNTGATIGKTAIANSPLTNCTLLQKSVALIKTKEAFLLPKILQYCYITNPEMYKVESSSAQPNLLLSKIRATDVYLPPISLQTQFAVFVQQVEAQKFLLQKSLAKLEQNYKSLMQKCFRGEIF